MVGTKSSFGSVSATNSTAAPEVTTPAPEVSTSAAPVEPRPVIHIQGQDPLVLEQGVSVSADDTAALCQDQHDGDISHELKLQRVPRDENIMVVEVYDKHRLRDKFLGGKLLVSDPTAACEVLIC